MTDNETINIGDICFYPCDWKTRSKTIVEVVKELSEEVVVVKFHQIISDDSGNGLFEYLFNTGKPMNVSRKYLKKIDLINRLQAENESLNAKVEQLTKDKENLAYSFANVVGQKMTAKAEAYKLDMRKFAGAIIRFLREYYDDAYDYNLTINQGTPWQECLTLDVKANHLTIHITESHMFHLYELYKDNDNVWQDQLQELIEN